MRKTRVLIVNHTARLGGAERVLLTFLSQTNLTKIDAKLTAPEGPLLEEARRLGIECYPLMSEELRSTRKSLAVSDVMKVFDVYRALIRVSKEVGPDILMSNSVKAHVLGNAVSRKLGIPLVIRLHDQLRTFSPLARRLILGPLRRAALVSCVSESVAEDVRNLVGSQCNVKVCYNGVSLDDKSNKCHVSVPRIVSAGWLFPWKGFHVFVQAMEMLAEQTEGWEFVIAGDVAADVGESIFYKKQLEQAIQRSKWRDRFVFAGAYDKLSDILCCAKHSIFVLPSQRPDPLPTVILEAGSLGVPVVATNLGGSREMILHGESGFLTDTTPEAISQAVLTLVEASEVRLRLGQALQSNVKTRFSISSYVANLGMDILSCVAPSTRS
jgi:glycosyltransferase involved in cell wall biosynthesis